MEVTKKPNNDIYNEVYLQQNQDVLSEAEKICLDFEINSYF